MLTHGWLRLLRFGRFGRLALLAVPLALALTAIIAATASAIVVRLQNGHQISFEAVTPSTPPAVNRFDDLFSNVDYNGGPVMPANTNYVIAWDPSGSNYQSTYLSGIQQFFQDLAHDSGQATNGDSVLTQYNDAAGQVAAYSSSFGGVLLDHDPLPPNGCSGAAEPHCITDAQIQTELGSFLAGNHLPGDLTHEYFLLTPPNIASCFDSSGADGCSDNYAPGPCTHDQMSCFCAYHAASATAGGTLGFIYANIPDLAGDAGCDPFASHSFGFCPVASCDYDNGPADGVLSAVEHEHAESVTDPEPNNGWTDWGSNNSTDFGQDPQELADKCNNDAFQDTGDLRLQQSGSTATPYNYVINGHHYLLQMLWSDQGRQCRHSFAPNGVSVHTAFTQIAGSGDSVTFDASGSTPSDPGTQYVWQFNDGATQQTNTFETNSPTASWRFPSAGAYDVALTVMAPDGTSNGTAHTVYAVDSGPNAAFVPTIAYAGVPTTFASDTSDPNANGGIVSYSWDFGDGTTGSGKTNAHIFARTGHYTVTLTVQDNYFAMDSVSENVTVAELPRASFGPKSGIVRRTIHFHAGGPDPPGTRYRWKFGDGTTGHGRDATHRYRRAGTYRVTLTIVYSNGVTRSVTSRVVIHNPHHPRRRH